MSMKTVAETDKQRWERETLAPALKKSPERAPSCAAVRAEEYLYVVAANRRRKPPRVVE